MIKTIILILFLTVAFTSCIDLIDKRADKHGASDNIAMSKLNKFYKVIYLPNQFEFTLLDGSVVKIDTAWAEKMWTYDNNGKPKLSNDFGSNFIIPIKKQEFDKFLFDFSLADTSNEYMTTGLEEKRRVLYPSNLFDTIKIILQQKNPKQEYGWMAPIKTDTIFFTKHSS
jgi:hypothetical protein